MKTLKFYIAALLLMVCSAANAQLYLNVEISNGVYKSFKVTENLKVSWGEKKEKEITGTAKRTGDIDVNWVQLWAGGPKFAKYNVGVTDGKEESYGGYYAWGGSQDKVNDPNTGSVDLTGDNDTATKLWGSNWRMPTKAELDGLLANCDVAWTTVNDVKGRKFTGKGDYASNSVFLPAAGYFNSGSVRSQGGSGFYWSSTFGSLGAYGLYFGSGSQAVSDYTRNCDYSVRAVLAE